MAIYYVFKINDPNNAGAFPPSVASSSWYSNLSSYLKSYSVGGSSLVFNNETELNVFLSTHTLTDAGLIADVEAWKSAHNVSYSNYFYTLPDAGITTPGVIS
jgi:hypothetical protein